MSAFTPDWKLTVSGVDYTDIAISDIQHEAGRTDIYQQPSPSYCSITLIALNGQTLPFDINDSFDLQITDSTAWHISPAMIQTLRQLKDTAGLPLFLELGEKDGCAIGQWT